MASKRESSDEQEDCLHCCPPRERAGRIREELGRRGAVRIRERSETPPKGAADSSSGSPGGYATGSYDALDTKTEVDYESPIACLSRVRSCCIDTQDIMFDAYIPGREVRETRRVRLPHTTTSAGWDDIGLSSTRR
jgi:hypothetical protein